MIIDKIADPKKYIPVDWIKEIIEEEAQHTPIQCLPRIYPFEAFDYLLKRWKKENISDGDKLREWKDEWKDDLFWESWYNSKDWIYNPLRVASTTLKDMDVEADLKKMKEERNKPII